MVRTKNEPKKRPASRVAAVVDSKAVGAAAPAAVEPAIAKPEKKKHRFRPGTVALRDIRRYQQSIAPLIQFKPFERLTREIAQKYGEMRFQLNAIHLIREAVEVFLVRTFNLTQLSAIHAHRITINDRDMRHVVELLTLEGVSAYIPGHNTKSNDGPPVYTTKKIKRAPAAIVDAAPITTTTTTATTVVRSEPLSD